MKKIPTLFVRDPEDRRYVTPHVTEGCEWVLAGEGKATRKYDGTCVMFDGEDWWARREVKPEKANPPGFVQVDYDLTTGKTMGWEPAGQSGFARWLAEVTEALDDPTPGTYELIGPKVNGNPEGVRAHYLVPHGQYELAFQKPTYEELRLELTGEDWPGWEGIVWHHPDGRMAKIKRRDFPPASGSRDGET